MASMAINKWTFDINDKVANKEFKVFLQKRTIKHLWLQVVISLFPLLWTLNLIIIEK